IDAEPLGEPLDRLVGRPRLAALDLADVLLGEALARELRLRHPGRDTQLPQPLAEPEPGLGGRHALLLLTGGGRVRHVRRSRRHTSPNLNPHFGTSPLKVMFWPQTGQASLLQIT